MRPFFIIDPLVYLQHGSTKFAGKFFADHFSNDRSSWVCGWYYVCNAQNRP